MSTKYSLLGLAFILFGIACLTTQIGHIPPDFILYSGYFAPLIGLFLCIIGFCTTDKKKD